MASAYIVKEEVGCFAFESSEEINIREKGSCEVEDRFLPYKGEVRCGITHIRGESGITHIRGAGTGTFIRPRLSHNTCRHDINLVTLKP